MGHYLIKDGNHFATIKGQTLKTHLVQDRNYTSGFLNDATEQLENFLKRKGMSSEGWFGLNKTLRYKEGILEQGERIAVYGMGTWKEVEGGNDLNKLLEITEAEDNAVYLSDDPQTLSTLE